MSDIRIEREHCLEQAEVSELAEGFGERHKRQAGW